MRNFIVQLLFLSALILTSIPSFSKIYTWTDNNGNVHFSDQKPEALNAEVINVDISKSNWSRFDIEIKAIDIVLSTKEINEIEEGVNDVYAFFDKVLFFDIHTTIPVNIMVLKDKSEYDLYLTEKV